MRRAGWGMRRAGWGRNWETERASPIVFVPERLQIPAQSAQNRRYFEKGVFSKQGLRSIQFAKKLLWIGNLVPFNLR